MVRDRPRYFLFSLCKVCGRGLFRTDKCEQKMETNLMGNSLWPGKSPILGGHQQPLKQVTSGARPLAEKDRNSHIHCEFRNFNKILFHKNDLQGDTLTLENVSRLRAFCQCSWHAASFFGVFSSRYLLQEFHPFIIQRVIFKCLA